MLKKILSFLFLISAAPSLVFAQAPWEDTPSILTYKEGGSNIGSAVVQLYAPQPNVLWGLSAGVSKVSPEARRFTQTVFCTTNNGQSWQTVEQSSLSSDNGGGIALEDLSILNEQTAWVLKGDQANMTLLHTTTGPTGFTVIASSLPAPFRSIHFFTPTTGIAVAPSNAPYPTSGPFRFYRTTDGGLTWTQLTTVPPALDSGWSTIRNVGQFMGKCSVGNNLWLSTVNVVSFSNSGTVFHTADAGLTWTATPKLGFVAFEQDGLHGLAYQNSDSGSLTQMVRTDDGGTTWTPLATQQPLLYQLIAVPGSPGTYINKSSQTMSISRDRGSSWQVLPSIDKITRIAANSATQLWGGLSASWPDYIMVKRYTGTILSTKKSLDSALRLTAYPNPTTGTIQLEGPLQGQTQVRVYDATGRLCQQQSASNTQRVINLADNKAGLYRLVITSETGVTQSQSIIKE